MAWINFPYSQTKKLILIGSDTPTAGWVKDNITRIEKSVLDGLVFHPGNTTINIWNPDIWCTDDDYLDHPGLSAIVWDKFQSNCFLAVYCSNYVYYELDLWNDANWINISDNMAALAKAAYDYGLAGIYIDAEPYSSDSPWNVSVMSGTHTTAETQAKIRIRGAQIMTAIQTQYPGIVVFFTNLHNTGDNYALFPHWFNGMLDVIGSSVKLIDGDESSYWFTNTFQYYTQYNDLKVTKSLVPYLDVANNTKYEQQVEIASAVNYDDLGIYTPCNEALKAERFEHNAYYAFASSDKWVWLYTSGTNLLGVPPEYQPNGNEIPITKPPIDELNGLCNARMKHSSGRPNGWDWHFHTIDGTSQDFKLNIINVKITGNNPLTAKATNSDAINTDGTIHGVEWYLNSVYLGWAVSAPYTMELPDDLPDGTYTAIAIAYCGIQWHGTSQPVQITMGGV